jgi:hypothetical protein
MKKSTILLIGTLFFLFLSTAAYSADIDGCTVERVGAYPGLQNTELGRSGYPVFLSHPDWSTTRMFYLSEDLGTAGLATILTAMSLEKTILVRIGATAAASASAGSIITVIYVNK